MSRRRKQPKTTTQPAAAPLRPDFNAASEAQMRAFGAALADAVRRRAARAEADLAAGAKTLELGDLPAATRKAIQAEVNWSRQTVSGVQRAAGVIRMERNVELAPYKARGLGHDPGVFWALRNLPETGAPLARMTREMAATPLRLEPAILPDWASEADEHLAAMQMELASRWLYAWQQDPNRRLAQLVRDVVDYAPACGFCTLELTAREGVITLSDGFQVRGLIPDVPAAVAPWSHRYWVTQGRELTGVVYDFGSVWEKDGSPAAGGGGEVYLPAEKVIHVGFDVTGQNYEGRSIMRPIFNQLHQLLDLYKLQALGAEVHALGELWFTQQATSPTGGTAPTLSPAAEALLRTILNSRVANFVPGALLPPGVEPVYGQAKANLPDLTPLIRTLREAVALVMGDEHRLMGTTGGSGTYAARKDASDDARAPLDDMFELLVATPLEATLARFLALAFPGAPIFCPRVTWGSVEVDTSTWLEDVAKAKAAGLLDDPDFGDQVRDALNLPPQVQADLANAAEADLPNDRFIRVEDAARIFSVSPAVIRGLIKNGGLAGRKVGRSYRVLVSSIRAYAAELHKAEPTTSSPPQPVV